MSLPSVLAMVPEDSGGPYVIAAYVVFLTIVVIYVAIMAQRLTKLSKQADEIEARLDARDAAAKGSAGAAAGAASAEASGQVDGAAEKSPEGVA